MGKTEEGSFPLRPIPVSTTELYSLCFHISRQVLQSRKHNVLCSELQLYYSAHWFLFLHELFLFLFDYLLNCLYCILNSAKWAIFCFGVVVPLAVWAAGIMSLTCPSVYTCVREHVGILRLSSCRILSLCFDGINTAVVRLLTDQIFFLLPTMQCNGIMVQLMHSVGCAPGW